MADIFTIDLTATSSTSSSISPVAGEGSWSPLPADASPGVPPLMDRGQAYYWTRVWQAGERETLEAYAKGKGKTFVDGKAAVAWLLDESPDD
jgi:hypothetical protein